MDASAEREQVVRSERLVDGVFQGGGAKGLAYLGALEALEVHGYWFRRVAGTSAGSFVAALIACGYRALPTAPRSLRVLLSLDHRAFQDGGLLTLPRRILADGGVFAGRRMTEVLDALFKEGLGLPSHAPSPTFKDLTTIDLYIIASNLTGRDVLVFSRHTTPELPIAEAVRMSASLPVFYVPCRWRPSVEYAALLGSEESQDVVDGGILSSFPMFIFKDPPPYLPPPSDEDLARPKIGFVLVEDEESGLDPIDRLNRRRRARPVRRWWLTTLVALAIAWVVFEYAVFVGIQLCVVLYGPGCVWGPPWWEKADLLAGYRLLDKLFPMALGTGLAWVPDVLRPATFILISLVTSLPRLVLVLLPIILIALARSEPGRLLRQLLGLVTVAFDKRHVRSQDVVEIFMGPYSTARFRLSDDQREDVIERGYEAVHRFLPEWETRQGLSRAR